MSKENILIKNKNLLGKFIDKNPKLFSPIYLGPNSTSKTKINSRRFRIGLFVTNAAGIVVSHTMFFRPSLSINAKTSFSPSSDVKLSQATIDFVNSKKLEAVGGSKYQDYINYFNQYPDGKLDDIKDEVLKKAVNDTIADGKTAYFNDRVKIFKTINDSTSDISGYEKVNTTEAYDAFFKTSYSGSSNMAEAALTHNAKYPHNKIYSSSNEISDKDAMIYIKKAADAKIEKVLDTKYNPFDVFSHADKIGFGFLFFIQWAIAIASATGIYTATSEIHKKATKSPSTGKAPASDAAEPVASNESGFKYSEEESEVGQHGIESRTPHYRYHRAVAPAPDYTYDSEDGDGRQGQRRRGAKVEEGGWYGGREAPRAGGGASRAGGFAGGGARDVGSARREDGSDSQAEFSDVNLGEGVAYARAVRYGGPPGASPRRDEHYARSLVNRPGRLAGPAGSGGSGGRVRT